MTHRDEDEEIIDSALDTLAWQRREIERLESEVGLLGSVVDALLQHDASSFWGAEAEKNRRASYRGVIRKAKKVRASLKG